MDNAAGPITPTEDIAAAAAPADAAAPAADQLPRDFAALHTAFREAMKGWDALPEDYTNAQSDAVADAVEPIREALIASPPLSPHELLQKLRVVTEIAPPRANEVERVMNDAERLLRRDRIYGTFAGLDAGMTFAASVWAEKARRAHAATVSESDMAEALDAMAEAIRPIETFPCTTAGEVALKARLIFCEYLGADTSDADHWPQPLFEGGTDNIPARALQSLYRDIEQLARRSAPLDRSEIVEKVARDVSRQASTAICALLHAETLIRAATAAVEDEILIYTSDATRGLLRDDVRDALRRVGNDLGNLLGMVADKVGEAQSANEAIEGADLVQRSKGEAL